jgi:hypothetical protein
VWSNDCWGWITLDGGILKSFQQLRNLRFEI